MKQSIVSLAQVIRSKNAGPYELVLDILFKTKENYERVKSSGQLTPLRAYIMLNLTLFTVLSGLILLTQ